MAFVICPFRFFSLLSYLNSSFNPNWFGYCSQIVLLGSILFLVLLLWLSSFPDLHRIVFEAQPICFCFNEFKLAFSACKISFSSEFVFCYYIIIFKYLCYPVLLIRYSSVLYLFLICPTRLCTSWRPELSFNLHVPQTQCFYYGRNSLSIYWLCTYYIPETMQSKDLHWWKEMVSA